MSDGEQGAFDFGAVTTARGKRRKDPEFDLAGPLPRGLTLLEASAGTGKTFAMAALAARYVAEGVPLERLLIVTFTRMATGELRERVRDRLVSSAAGLQAHLAGSPAPDDEVLAVLTDRSPEVVALRLQRLEKAIANFDAATIETTHGFCLQMLAALGTAGDVERDVALIEDPRDLIDEVVDDVHLRSYRHQPDPPERSRTFDLAWEVQLHAAAGIVPAPGQAQGQWGERADLARTLRAELASRKRAAGAMTFDDVLLRLRDTIRDGPRGRFARQRLRDRFDVVMIDEFQDTDPVQWDIVWQAFASGGTALVLIGDPKQAIYAFRGADVRTYLAAADRAPARATLQVNWRSDQGLLEAFNALFDGAHLGDQRIQYLPVKAAPPNKEARLVGAPGGAPLRVRVLRRDSGVTTTKQQGLAQVDSARAMVAADVVADIVRLLEARVGVVEEDGAPRDRPIGPGDIGVLVRTNKQANAVQHGLWNAGVPAVIAGAASVFVTQPAREWLRLLQALKNPSSRVAAAGAAATAVIGWDAAALADADSPEWEELHWRLHQWAGVLRLQGVAALFQRIVVDEQLPARLLRRRDGERFLTDLRHVAQLLQVAATEESLSTTALGEWLRRRICEVESRAEAENEDRTRRLDSDALAVQVLTVHRSKGLEFPVVYCPYLWDGQRPQRSPAIAVYHDPERGNARTIDVSGPDGPGFAEHRQLHEAEERGEELRLMYVALTRAKHQSVLWWAPSQGSAYSALGRIVFPRAPDGSVVDHLDEVPSDEQAESRLRAFGPLVGVERVEIGDPRRWTPEPTVQAGLSVRRFERLLDRAWRRTSYSALTAAAHEHGIGSEPDETVLNDEPDQRPAAVTGAEPEPGAGEVEPWADWRTVPLLLGEMPGGTRVGTLVHHVLEATDFAAPDLRAEVAQALDGQLARWPIDVGDPSDVVDGLTAALEHPLGELSDGLPLRAFARRDRVDELAFELPLAGGDDPGPPLSLHEVGSVLRAHLDPSDPLAIYADRLDDQLLAQPFRGFLTGSLDVVLRRTDGRFVLADYKTNRLGVPGEPLTAWDYRPHGLGQEMALAHYPLQALLYLVALHRYLRWRLRGYDPDRHLGGVLYLFVRGMSSPEHPTVGGVASGVWSWSPPTGLVPALSDLFDRGGPGAGGR